MEKEEQTSLQQCSVMEVRYFSTKFWMKEIVTKKMKFQNDVIQI